jgi:hypothetical protein
MATFLITGLMILIKFHDTAIQENNGMPGEKKIKITILWKSDLPAGLI